MRRVNIQYHTKTDLHSARERLSPILTRKLPITVFCGVPDEQYISDTARQKGVSMMTTWILPTFVTFIGWGAWGFIPKITTRYISPMSAMIYETTGATIVGLVILILVDFRPDVHFKGICLAITTGIIGMTGALCFLFAVKSGSAAAGTR